MTDRNFDHSKPESWKYTGTIYGTATTPVVQSAECVCRGKCGMLKHLKLPADFPLYEHRSSAENSGVPESVVMSRDCDEEIAMRKQTRHTAAEERESVAVWLDSCGNVDLAENVRKGLHRLYLPMVEKVCDCGRKDCKYCYLLPAAVEAAAAPVTLTLTPQTTKDILEKLQTAADRVSKRRNATPVEERGSCPSCYGVVKPVYEYDHGSFGFVLGGPPARRHVAHWVCDDCGTMYGKCPKKPKKPEQE